MLDRLGPDPLHNARGSRDDFVRRVLSKRTPLATLLMDQKLIAGVGNVYRAEVLFRQRMDPCFPAGAAGGRRRVGCGTTPRGDGRRRPRRPDHHHPSGFWTRSDQLPPGEEAHFVYRRHGRLPGLRHVDGPGRTRGPQTVLVPVLPAARLSQLS